jgi:adenosylhomocysteine nucleosidase
LKTVVIISADGEWGAVKTLMPRALTNETRLGDSFEAVVDGRHVTFFHGGWGRVLASATTQFVIDQMRPELIVNLGTCGGFRGRIEQGAIILVEKTVIYDIVEQMTDPDAAIEHYSTRLDLSWLPRVAPSPVTRGLMLSGDRDILAQDIAALIKKYDAVAADWESGAIAWVAAKNLKPLLILRGVSDLVDKDGGEAYRDYELFVARTREIMRDLIGSLPKWLDAIERERRSQRV